MECEKAVDNIDEGDTLAIYPEEGKIVNLTKNEEYHTKPLPEFMKNILKAGGLIPYIIKHYKNKE